MAIEIKSDYHIDSLIDLMSVNWTPSARRNLKVFDGAIPFWGPFLSTLESWCPSLDGIYANAPCDATGRLTKLAVIGSKSDKVGGFTFSKIDYLSKSRINVRRGWVYEKQGDLRVFNDEGVIINGQPKLTKLGKIKRLDAFRYPTQTRVVNEWRIHEKEFIGFAKAAPGLFFSLYHTWSVYFSTPGNISVRFPIDARIALELFKDREKERGELRRKALLHWVQAHTRRNPNNTVDMVQVRKYIRGKTAFFWKGFDCVIAPDDDYLDSLEGKGNT